MNIKKITLFLLFLASPSLLFAARPSINVLNTRVNQIEAEVTQLQAEDVILHDRIDTIELIPGPKGDKGDPGPQGPTGADGSGNGLMSLQVFSTSGVHNWTKPAGVSKIKVIVTGGGGGGGSHNADDAQGGGGAGGTSIKVIDVEAVLSAIVTVGEGGTGSCGNTSNGGTDGASSSFGNYLSSTGGSRPMNWAIGGSGGTGAGGDINLKGSDGMTGMIDGQGNEETGGNGGSSFWGGGGTGGSVWGSRSNGVQGSGGGGTHVNTNNCGGDGGEGMVVVYEYGSKPSVVNLPSGVTSSVVSGDSSGVVGAVCITYNGNMYIDTDGVCAD